MRGWFAFAVSACAAVLIGGGATALTAGPLRVGSVAESRFGTSWTLDGSEMLNTRGKLLNPWNFGTDGTVRRGIEITDTAAAQGSIDDALLEPFEIFFIGWLTDGSPNAFTVAELEALATWTFRGGTLIVTCDDSAHDRVCEYLGYPMQGGANSPAVPGDGLAAHPLLKGPFGGVSEVILSGFYGGFDRATGADPILRDPSAPYNPVVMTRRWGAGRLVLISDVDILANAATPGDSITTANDRFLGNLFAYVARPYDEVLDAAAHTGGASNSEWRDDVDLLNLGAVDAEVAISLLRANQTNLTPSTTTVVVPAGRTLRLVDVLGGLFNLGNAGLGLSLASADVLANSRFYNVGSPSGNVYGMYVPSTSQRETVRYGQMGVFHHLSYSPSSVSGSRVNIGGTSRSPFAVEVVITLFGDAGQFLGSQSHTFLPYEHRQFTKIHQLLGTPAVTHGHATAEVKTAGGAVDMYAMLIENRSGDPIFMPPAFSPAPGIVEALGAWPAAAEPSVLSAAEASCAGPYHRIIAAAANTTGVNLTKWLTDADLLNLGPAPAVVDIARLKANQSNTDPLVATVVVPAGETVRLTNILGTLLPAGNAGLGFRHCSGEAYVNSRFYNTGSASGDVYGMFVPSMARDQAVTPCHPGVFHHLSYSPDSKVGQRINIGATNATDLETDWTIRLYGDDGSLVGAQTATLLPYEHRQYTNIHKLLGAPPVGNGWATVEVTTPGAAIHPYAMRIENVGGDPIYMPAELLDVATSERVAGAFTGTWSGEWHNTTFQTAGDAELTLSFDLANQHVEASVDLDGNVFGGADPPPEQLVGTITAGGLVLEGTSATLGTYSVTIDGFCAVAGTLTALPNPNIASVEITGHASPTGIHLSYTVYFTAQGGGGTATGILELGR